MADSVPEQLTYWYSWSAVGGSRELGSHLPDVCAPTAWWRNDIKQLNIAHGLRAGAWSCEVTSECFASLSHEPVTLTGGARTVRLTAPVLPPA